MRNSQLLNAQILNDMGITLWKERENIPTIETHNCVLGIKCLILLSEKITTSALEAKKVLQGMINVLGLREDEYCIGSVTEQGFQHKSLLVNKIRSFMPKALLCMGNTFQDLQEECKLLQIPLKFTYHPLELVEEPLHKKQAYRDLLMFKQSLENINNIG